MLHGVLTIFQGFRKYIPRDRDQFELLSFVLGGIIKDRMRFNHLQQRRRHVAQAEDDGALSSEVVTVPLSEFQARARDLGIHDTEAFLHGRLFRTNGYTYDQNAQTIIKTFGNQTGLREEL